MIKPGEIQQKARAIGVRDQQIEKEIIRTYAKPETVSGHIQESQVQKDSYICLFIIK
jgi:hypothetical protein